MNRACILLSVHPHVVQKDRGLPFTGRMLKSPRAWTRFIGNVVTNGIEAMPHGKSLSVGAKNLSLNEDGKDPVIPLPEGKYVEISIQDSGSGIHPDCLPKIFDPYFSTKERGARKGMGLGLATAQAMKRKRPGTGRKRSVCTTWPGNPECRLRR